jgi:hypothetical protein
VDAKNTSKWSSKFISKLKSDQRVLSADWAILASNTYPRDSARGLCVVDGVIVSDPTYVVTLVELLRRQIIDVHKQRLTGEARNEKAAALLDFVASPGCADLLDQFAKISDGLQEIEAKEISVHQTTWKRRGELIGSLQRAHQEFLTAFDAIMNGTDPALADGVVA